MKLAFIGVGDVSSALDYLALLWIRMVWMLERGARFVRAGCGDREG
jgi:hypothetical protein